MMKNLEDIAFTIVAVLITCLSACAIITAIMCTVGLFNFIKVV